MIDNTDLQEKFEAKMTFGKQNQDLEMTARPKKTLKILTLNMFLRPLVKNNESDHKYERLDDFTANYIKDFDIICNQEVFEGFNSFKATLTSKAAEVGFVDYACATRPAFFDKYVTDSGLIILSKYPIVETDSIVYVYNLHDDSASSKGSVYAKIEVNGHYIHVFNTHMQASYYPTFDTYKK